MNISISIQFHDPFTIGKLSIRRVKICNFSRIGRKNEIIRAFESAKNDIARRAYMVTVLYIHVGPDKSGQVRTGVKYYFSSNVSPTLFKFGPPPNLHAVS